MIKLARKRNDIINNYQKTFGCTDFEKGLYGDTFFVMYFLYKELYLNG